jgi:very-short-patch-repair endonuclease
MAHAGVLHHHIDGQLRPDEWDQAIADLAGRQHAVVVHRQLRELGMPRGAVEHRLRRGRLHVVHRGVYAVGHRVLSMDGWRMAAVLAAGPRAVLSHRDAAAVHGLRVSDRALTEVTLPYRRKPSPGIQAHHALLPDDEITTARGIPVTTVPRTILDLAALLPRNHVERLIKEAEVLRLTDRLSLHDLLARYPRRHGTRAIRSILATLRIGDGVPKSVLEDAFLEFLDFHRLPRPEVNAWLTLGRHTFQPDCLWRAQKVIVELDSHAFHGTPAAFEKDRARDRVLAVHEWLPIRVTWAQLHHEPDPLGRDLRVVLAG